MIINIIKVDKFRFIAYSKNNGSGITKRCKCLTRRIVFDRFQKLPLNKKIYRGYKMNFSSLTIVFFIGVSRLYGEILKYREKYANFKSLRDIKAVLYTTIEPKNGIKLLTTDGLIQENIESMNGTHWTKVLIHGWEAFGGSSWPQDFLDAYMFDPERSVPYNIIVIEWLRAKNLTPFNWSLYITKTGKQIAEFLKVLNASNRIDYSKTHLIGHSFGAQVSGAVGYYTDGKIKRITGMDPALLVEGAEHLRKSDAKYVDVIHTSILGDKRVLGHINFYPNGGEYQDCNGICSHFRAHEFMLESIRNPSIFAAKECRCYMSYLMNNCESNEVAFMGEHVNETLIGNFFLHIAKSNKTDTSSFTMANQHPLESMLKNYDKIKKQIQASNTTNDVCQYVPRQFDGVVSSSGRTMRALSQAVIFLKELTPFKRTKTNRFKLYSLLRNPM